MTAKVPAPFLQIHKIEQNNRHLAAELQTALGKIEQQAAQLEALNTVMKCGHLSRYVIPPVEGAGVTRNCAICLLGDAQTVIEQKSNYLGWNEIFLKHALKMVDARDELIAELRRQIDDLCAKLGEADSKVTAPRDTVTIPAALLSELAPDHAMNQDEQGGCVWCGQNAAGQIYCNENPESHEKDCPWVQARKYLPK